MKTLALASLVWLGSVSAASAQFVYDEAVDGDLSDDPGAPTLVDFITGTNTVTGTVEESNA